MLNIKTKAVRFLLNSVYLSIMNISATSDKEAPAINQALVYEEMDGKPLYYRGYRDVLNNLKTVDDIIGSSSLQATIIRMLLKFLYAHVDGQGFEVYTNEAGLHLARGNNLSSDIMIYPVEMIQSYQVDEHYFQIPPKVVVEIDIKVDLSDAAQEAYVKKKTEKLFQFGVERVIWVFSASQQVILAELNQDWLIRDWHLPFVIVDNYSINIGEMLRKRGVDKTSDS